MLTAEIWLKSLPKSVPSIATHVPPAAMPCTGAMAVTAGAGH